MPRPTGTRLVIAIVLLALLAAILALRYRILSPPTDGNPHPIRAIPY